MGADTLIEWADDTVNPVIGCQRVSPGCEHCYAERLRGRFGFDEWGPSGTRTVRIDAAVRELERSAKRAVKEGQRRRVFIGSLCDVFESHKAWEPVRPVLWATLNRLARDYRVGNRPALAPLLTTKRPDVARSWVWEHGWITGAMLLVSVEDQQRADERIPVALSINVPVGLSMEPLLGPVDLTRINMAPMLWAALPDRPPLLVNVLSGFAPGPAIIAEEYRLRWVIVGGESGPKARPMHPEWARSLRDQCADAEVPFLFKQWGEYAPGEAGVRTNWVFRAGKKAAGRLLDGRTWDEIPEEVR